VGGVTQRITEDKLRGYFSQFGAVQSIIMNLEKRCAFLKMYTRDGAILAREGMEAFSVEDTTIRVCTPFPCSPVPRPVCPDRTLPYMCANV
jgi:protein NRD1